MRLKRLVTPPVGPAARALVVGEVLWDVFPDAARLGGAALNFAAHFKRLGHAPQLLSAVGDDAFGHDAFRAIEALGLDTAFLQTLPELATGRAQVTMRPGGDVSFSIVRPAAYDGVELSHAQMQKLERWNPAWIYYGTLFPSRQPAKRLLTRVLDALPDSRRFYDVNLRAGFDAPALVDELLRAADVVKLNEQELQFAHEHLNLPADAEGFCREGSRRYGWQAACVTFGGDGCAIAAGGDYVIAPGCAITVADSVGAGDAFSAALLHGLIAQWPAATIAGFANRIGALIASRSGAIPEWTPEELMPR